MTETDGAATAPQAADPGPRKSSWKYIGPGIVLNKKNHHPHSTP